MYRRPVALTSLLALGLAAAIAGVNTLTSEATAYGRHTTAVPTASASATASASPSVSASVSAAPSASASDSDSGVKKPAAGSASSASPDVVAPPARGTTNVASTSTESNRVGALFAGDVATGNHFCSASVIHSATRNLILTAAHCVSSIDGVHFAPAYRDGNAPYGSWQVTKIYTSDGWSQNGDQDEDFAILEVASTGGHDIEDVVGGNTLGLSADFSADVRLYGYPSNREVPILCTNSTAKQDTYQRRIDCPSYPGGTSGGPWIDTATNKVIGVIGGYQQGGDTDDTSYSSYFDHTINTLYQQAVAGSA